MENNIYIHDGVSIKIVEAPQEGQVIIKFTDQITAFSKIKKAVIKDKGIYCSGISTMVLELLEANGIKTHFIKKLSETEQLCAKIVPIPLEFIVRNVVAGSLAERLGLKEGLVPASPIYDLCYKSEALNDPLINNCHAVLLGIVTEEELAQLQAITAKINTILVDFFAKAGITLVDFKIEFGKLPDGSFVLCDDITPDTARMWDAATGERLDKDRFRHDMSKVGESDKNVYERLKANVQ